MTERPGLPVYTVSYVCVALDTGSVEPSVAMRWKQGNWELLLESRCHVGSRELGRNF